MKRFVGGRSRLGESVFFLLVACGGRTELGFHDPDEGACVPGYQIACACPGGGSGVQVCRTDQSFGFCSCGEATGSGVAGSVGAGGATSVTPTGGNGARSGVGNAGGSGGFASNGGASGSNSSGGSAGSGGTSPFGMGGTGAQPVPVPTTFGTRPGTLIDAFPAESGILVVEANAVVKLDRSGAELVRVTSERENTAAAFDGGRLVVADRAVFTVYDEDLGVLRSARLIESCASLVMVSGARMVCGPSNDWDRIFYTYDTSTGQRLASSSPYTYNGIPMRRVPGSDDFITVTTDLSPSDFHLYSVLATGEAVYIGESPYHGDFSVTNVYTFDGDPTNVLLTNEGLMLDIYGEGCVRGQAGDIGSCFVRSGDLGTLFGSERFAGMDSSGGVVYGLVSLSGPDFATGAVLSTYGLQRIDVAARRRLSEHIYAIEGEGVSVARHDAWSSSMLVGLTPTPIFFSTPPSSYQLLLLSYE